MFSLGILMLLLSLVCLGTWPAFMRLCSCEKELAEIIQQSRRRSTQTFLTAPQNRHPCHVYLDYSFSYVIASSIPVMMQIISEHSNSFIFAKPLLIGVAMMGGSLLSFANISMQWSTSVYNAPLTTVVALQSSSFLIAIVSASTAQILYQKQKTNNRGEHVNTIVSDGVPLYPKNDDSNHGSIELPNASFIQTSHSSLNDSDDYIHSRDASSKQSHVQLGLVVAFVGGICIGFFTPSFNIAVNDPFQWYDDGGLDLPYANLWFAFAFTLCSVIGNLRLMKGTAFSTIPSTTWRNYTSESWYEKRLAFCAGMICAFGNWLQFQGGFLAGFAAADMVQAFPLVSTLWDYFLFHEFRQTSCNVGCILSIMYASYLLGISMLVLSISE